MSRKVKCPTCSTDVLWDESSVFRPFCSKRCRLIDLGAWADESHRIPGEPLENVSTDSQDDADRPPFSHGDSNN